MAKVFLHDKSACSSAPRAAAGQAMLEFVLVFPIILVLVMGIIEMSFLSVAHQSVNYAAFCVARSAIVNGAFDRAAALAMMTVSPLADAGKGSPPGDLVSKAVQLRIRYAENRLRNAWWQTYVWVECYNRNDSKIKTISSHQGGTTSLPDSTDYVKAGVLYLYKLKFPVISTIVNFAAKYMSSPSIGDVKDVFGADVDPETSGMPYDQWSEAQRNWEGTSAIYVPIVKWTIMGRN